ncbi:hypothetical protein MW887_009397 [Aspergillus wentii]|nr:hypothetical protein MW887_009397 [Aspergillus wentii]
MTHKTIPIIQSTQLNIASQKDKPSQLPALSTPVPVPAQQKYDLIMPGDEYAAGGGGKLKLKGSKVSDGRVEKKKKKKAKKEEKAVASAGAGEKGGDESATATTPVPGAEESAATSTPQEGESGGVVVGKTEAEQKYEDARRKRLQERLKRDGVKTHKERVEELNKYLSRLSEHHDMPKIGPG